MKPTAGWTDRDWTEKVIVLDLEDADRTLAAVEDLRLRGVRAPLVIVSGSTSTWRSIGGLYPDVVLLELPLNAAALNAAIDRAAQLTQSDALAVSAAGHVRAPSPVTEQPRILEPEQPKVAEQPDPGQSSRLPEEAAGPPLAAPPGPAGSDEDLTLPSPRSEEESTAAADDPVPEDRPRARQRTRKRKPSAADAKESQPRSDEIEPSSTSTDESTAPRPAATAESGATERPLSTSLPLSAALDAVQAGLTTPPSESTLPRSVRRDQTAATVATATPHRQVLDPMALVRALKGAVSHLPQVVDLADLLREQCHSAVRADASTLLLPDDDVWRVEAGKGLRPLEERLQIKSGHWLVAKVGRGGDAILIQNTDVARNQLSGSPLASWPNLMAVPVPEVQGIVLLARRGEPFTRAELERAAAEVETIESALRDALEVRELARLLAVYTDPV
jgi:hypothetical protein